MSAGNTVTAFSPASNTHNWVARVAPSAYSFSGTQGQTTGASTVNIITLSSSDANSNPNQWYDSNIIARFQKTNSGDACGLVVRCTDSNHYYRASVTGNNLQIAKNVGGTITVLGNFSFTDGGSLFWIRFLCQGFGFNGAGGINNLQAKAWLDGNSEPASYQIGFNDASLTAIGYVGIHMKGNSAGTTQSVDSFTSIDPTAPLATPAYNATQDAPYGVTSFVGSGSQIISQQLITDLQAWENGVWNRWQAKWSQLQTSVSVINWAPMDDLVYRCNQAGIKVVWPIQSAPSWLITVDAYGNDSTLNTTMNSGTGYTSINISALRAGGMIPHQGQLTVDSGGANPESFYIWNPGNFYTSGTTTISISSSKNSQVAFTPAHNHSIGAQIYEAVQGAQYANSSDFSTFAGLAAARYNGSAGYGKVDIFQVENEAYDSNWLGTQSTGAWDVGGSVLAPVYYASRNSIQAQYAGCVVIPCSVRKTTTIALTHIANWLTYLVQGIQTLGGTLDGMDFHYYRGTANYNNLASLDPTTSTYTDATLATINTPSVALEISTIKGVLVANGFSAAQINCWECGWDIYDDGAGVLTTLSSGLTAGTPYTSLPVASTPAAITDAEPIYLDYNNTSIAEGGGIPPTVTGLYAYGNNPIHSTTLTITTDPRGSFPGIAAPFTPVHNHSNGAQVYASVSAEPTTQAFQSQYITSMMDAMRTAGCKRCFPFTDQVTATVDTTVYPNSSTSQKSITQTISSVYTYMQAYTDLKNTYIPKYPLWTSTPTVKTVGQITTTTGSGTTSPVIGNDTFIKPNNGSSWGNATDGQTWNENVGSGTVSIVSNEGVLVSTGADTDVQLGIASATDVELLVRFSLNHLLDVAGVQGRYSVSGGNVTCYKFLFYAGQCHINKSINGANTNLTNAGSQITANAYYWLRFRIQGINLSGKYWQDGTTEPPAWTTTTSDSSITGAGGIALLGNTDTGSTGVHFDSFTATNLAGGTGSTGGGATSGTLNGQSGPQTTAVGPYTLQLNEWNSSATEQISYAYPPPSFTVTNSAISNATNGAPGTYTSFYCGNHWGSISPTNPFPLQVSAIATGQVLMSMAGSLISTGAWDFAYDNWFVPSSTDNQGSGHGSLEMMIWLNHFGPIQPAGSKVASSVSIGGNSYDVWWNGGSTLSYVFHTGVNSVTNLDYQPIIADAVSRGYLSNSWYLIDIEGGFELWQGGTGLAVTSFSISGVSGVSGGSGGGGNTGVNTMRLGTKTLADVEAYVRLSVSNVADSAGITLRDQGLTQYLRLQLTATQTQIIAQTPAGGIVTLATYAYTITTGTFYWLKFRVIGTKLYGKIWRDGTNEPGGWLLSTTSSAVTGAGQVGLAATLVAVGDVAAFDTFQATTATLNTFVTTVMSQDVMMRAGIVASTGTVTKDVAMRARLVDLSQNAVTVTTYAAKRPPLIRKFPKS